MEDYTVIPRFPYDPAFLFPHPLTDTQVRQNLVFQVGKHYGWPKTGSTTDQIDVDSLFAKTLDLKENGHIWLAELDIPQKTNQMLLIHCYPDQGRWYTEAFVFPEPEVPSYGDYYEYSGRTLFRQDSFAIYRKYTSYAYDADIHDSDTYTVSLSVKYDFQNRILYFPRKAERE